MEDPPKAEVVEETPPVVEPVVEPAVEAKPTAAKAKPTAAKRKGRKTVKKKPDDMPRRPLSAYNFFFSEMRTTLLADRAKGVDTEFQQFMADREAVDGNKKNGFFSNMGKFVAKRWKELTPEDLKPYTAKAETDLQRYRREMDEYREGVARKTRLASEQKLREQEAEAVKAAQAPPVPAAGQGGAPNWMMGGGNPMMGFQNPADPSFQMLLRQQLLQAQNPQLQAFLLQQQLGSGGMQGFPGQFGGFQQAAQQQSGGQQSQGQPGQDMGLQQGMEQNNDLLNRLQQQQQAQAQQQQGGGMAGMYGNMGQFAGMTGMPMSLMAPNASAGGSEGTGGGGFDANAAAQQLNMQQGGAGMPGAGGQWQ